VATFGAPQMDLDAVTEFAREHGLKIVEQSIGKRLVRLAGTVQAINEAFGVVLDRSKLELLEARDHSKLGTTRTSRENHATFEGPGARPSRGVREHARRTVHRHELLVVGHVPVCGTQRSAARDDCGVRYPAGAGNAGALSKRLASVPTTPWNACPDGCFPPEHGDRDTGCRKRNQDRKPFAHPSGQPTQLKCILPVNTVDDDALRHRINEPQTRLMTAKRIKINLNQPDPTRVLTRLSREDEAHQTWPGTIQGRSHENEAHETRPGADLGLVA
jgi:hypothetical protein